MTPSQTTPISPSTSSTTPSPISSYTASDDAIPDASASNQRQGHLRHREVATDGVTAADADADLWSDGVKICILGSRNYQRATALTTWYMVGLPHLSEQVQFKEMRGCVPGLNDDPACRDRETPLSRTLAVGRRTRITLAGVYSEGDESWGVVAYAAFPLNLNISFAPSGCHSTNGAA